MKKILLSLLLTILLIACCRQSSFCQVAHQDTVKIPPAIQKIIDRLKSAALENPPASIYRYDYNGQKVYYKPAPCCDRFSSLMNEKGEVICHPDGGRGGQGDGTCPDFMKNKKNEVLIWEDQRTP